MSIKDKREEINKVIEGLIDAMDEVNNLNGILGMLKRELREEIEIESKKEETP